MDFDSQIMKIKQEKYDEKDIHNEDYIVKLENENLIEINSHGIKTEINNQEEIDSTTSAFEFVGTGSSNEESQFQDTKIKIKSEYPETYTGQHIEKLGSSSSNDTNEHATVYSAWHRIKEEPTTGSWSVVKTEEVDVTEVEVKCEKPESKLTIQQLEDMDSLQLSKLLDIETKVDPTIFSAEPDSDSENGSKELHVVHGEPQTDIFICYNCSYMSLFNDDLLDHVSAGNCVLEQSDSSVTETKILNSQLSKHPGTASRHNIGSRVPCDQSSIIKKTPGKHATYKIHTCKNGDYITTSNSCSDCHTSVHSDSASAVELEICTYCGKTFKRKSLLDYHMVTVHLGHLINTGKMHAGMFKTVTQKQLQRQRKDSREASSTAVFCSETDLTSDNCGLNINAESSQIVTLGDHMSKNKLEHSDPKFDSDTDSNEKVKLDDVISKKQPEHSSNSDPSIHQCKHCNFKTTRKVYLNRHIRKYHDMSKNYTVPCVHCGQVFTSKRTLGGHIIRKHPDFISSVPCKLYECTSCDYKTTYKSSLDWHMVMHSCTVYGATLKICMYCGVAFPTKWLLDGHIVRKHPGCYNNSSVTRKLHECSRCPYKTMQPSLFKKHLLLKHSRKVWKVTSVVTPR